MRMKKILLTALLACLVLLGGCSRPASDHPDDNEDPSPVTENQEEESSETPQEETDDSPSDETSSEENEEDQKEENEDEESQEESSDSENPEDNSSQGCYKIFDSGFEITVEDPFVVYYDPLSNNMTVTIPDDPSSRGYIFYDTSEQSMTQLETTVKSLESASEADPTITNMTKDVDEQENGMFSMTFTYSAGANEGSAAGFYFIHYQTTENGVINVNLFTTRSSNSEKILELIDSIQPATENAVEYSE